MENIIAAVNIVAMHKIRTPHTHQEGKIFAWMALLLGLAIGLLDPIFPNFVKAIVKSEYGVSIFYAGMAIVMLFSAISSSLILKKVHRTFATKISFALFGSGIFALIFSTTLTHLSLATFLRAWFGMIISIILGLFVRDFARKQELGQNEGLHYKFQNIGFLIGPLLGGFLAVKASYEIVFLLASIILFVTLIYFIHQHVIENHPAIHDQKYSKEYSFLKSIRQFFSNPDFTKAYFITFMLMSWSAFKRLYVPLYVVLSTYKEGMSGLILSLTILPLILLEVRVGEYADKHGIRIPISTGFLIMSLFLVIIFLCPYPLVNFFLFVVINIGKAFIEPLQEYYLFKYLAPEQEEDLYGIYMTSDTLAFLITPLLGALILLFLPFKALFLVFGIFFGLMAYYCWLKLQHS